MFTPSWFGLAIGWQKDAGPSSGSGKVSHRIDSNDLANNFSSLTMVYLRETVLSLYSSMNWAIAYELLGHVAPNPLVIRSVRHASGLATACTVTLNPDTVLPSDLPLIFQINLYIFRVSSVSGIGLWSLNHLLSFLTNPLSWVAPVSSSHIWLWLSSSALCPNPIIYVESYSHFIPLIGLVFSIIIFP